jgi:hypothetical protein
MLKAGRWSTRKDLFYANVTQVSDVDNKHLMRGAEFVLKVPAKY